MRPARSTALEDSRLGRSRSVDPNPARAEEALPWPVLSDVGLLGHSTSESWSAPRRHPEDGSPMWFEEKSGLVYALKRPVGGAVLLPVTVQGEVIRFFAVGDTGGDPTLVARAASEMNEKRQAHFGVHVGDFVYKHAVKRAEDEELEGRLFERFRTLAPMYLALGNHEYGTAKGAANPDCIGKALPKDVHGRRPFEHPARYYGFSYKAQDLRVDAFVLDTSVLPFDVSQRRWLDRVLLTSKADWRIVVGHHPLDVEGGSMLQHLAPILERHGVDLYLTGHRHVLEVGDHGSVPQVVTGTGSKVSKRTDRQEAAAFFALERGFVGLELTRKTATIRVYTTGVDGRAGSQVAYERQLEARPLASIET